MGSVLNIMLRALLLFLFLLRIFMSRDRDHTRMHAIITCSTLGNLLDTRAHRDCPQFISSGAKLTDV
jgi:hypothetical protein